ncbi:MAG: right-handed parallel beta-helix repeat-containing protein, partial [Acidobacteriota bacterium]|nr:right-handed parallel beta-helix repeat-containing protein [Acidobacteriota bacterium]
MFSRSRSFRLFFKRPLFTSTIIISVLILLGVTSSSARGATIIVPAGGNLQAAVNAAQCGDTLILEPNATFVAPSDGLVASTQCAASPITVRTANVSNLPSGTRVGSTDAPNLARIVTPGPYPAITFGGGSQGWKFIGIEITTWPNIDNQHYVSTLVNIGRYVSPSPSDITFDRCWIHSQEDGTDSLTTTVKILVDAEGVNVSLLNSRIASPGAYIVSSTTFDNTAAVMMINGPGPLTIDNCFLNSWFTGFFMGGGDLGTDNRATVLPSPAPTLHSATLSNVNNLSVGDLMAIADGLATEGYPGLYYRVAKVTGISGTNVTFDPYAGSIGSKPSCTGDCGIPLTAPPISPGGAQWNGTNPGHVTITHSTFWINPTIATQIYSTTNRVPKGFFEVKAADGLYMEGNNFTGWPATFALTQHNQTGPHGGPSPWSVIRNVTIRSNRFNTAVPFGSQLFGLLLEDNVGTSVVGGNVLIENNLFTSGGWVGDFFAGNGITIRHNTILNNVGWANGRLLNVSYVPINNFTINDNVVFNNEYGLNYSAGGSISGLAMTGNVLITGTIDPYRPNCFSSYPAGNFCPADQSSVGFIDAASGNYRLGSFSRYRNQASDGTDPGINQDALEAALAGGTSTPPPTPTPTPTPSPTPTPTPPPPPSTINVAAAANGATVTASSVYSSAYTANGVIDGDRKGVNWGNGGGWNDATPDVYADWLKVDFDGAKTIGEIDVYTLQDDSQHPAEPTDAMTFSQYGIVDF